jgi:hypothetical protein
MCYTILAQPIFIDGIMLLYWRMHAGIEVLSLYRYEDSNSELG